MFKIHNYISSYGHSLAKGSNFENFKESLFNLGKWKPTYYITDHLSFCGRGKNCDLHSYGLPCFDNLNFSNAIYYQRAVYKNKYIADLEYAKK